MHLPNCTPDSWAESVSLQVEGIGSLAPRPPAVKYDQSGRPVKATLHRVGTTSQDFVKSASGGRMVRVVTDNEEVIGYLLRRDLAGVRVGHCLGYRRSGYGQAKRQQWVIDDVKFFNIRQVAELN